LNFLGPSPEKLSLELYLPDKWKNPENERWCTYYSKKADGLRQMTECLLKGDTLHAGMFGIDISASNSGKIETSETHVLSNYAEGVPSIFDEFSSLCQKYAGNAKLRCMIRVY